MRRSTKRLTLIFSALSAIILAGCGTTTQGALGATNKAVNSPSKSSTTVAPTSVTSSTTTTTAAPSHLLSGTLDAPLPVPAPLAPFGDPAVVGQGVWTPAGRLVDGIPAVYEAKLVPPGGTEPAGIAWMDTGLLSARLYSGSRSPGGGPYHYTAPVQPVDATSLVAAFNGGFIMNVAHGGYYTEGRVVDPLVNGAASLVIYSDGSVNVGAWGSDVAMTPSVVSVRQNLVPLVSGGQPTAQAASADWQAWGATCGANSCVGPGIENQWRSGVGITANGALVYVTGPSLDPLQLAQLLVRSGAIRGMQLDINPYWTVLVTYSPSTSGGAAAPSNGSKLLPGTVQGPQTFFESWWARDFITMSARPVPAG